MSCHFAIISLSHPALKKVWIWSYLPKLVCSISKKSCLEVFYVKPRSRRCSFKKISVGHWVLITKSSKLRLWLSGIPFSNLNIRPSWSGHAELFYRTAVSEKFSKICRKNPQRSPVFSNVTDFPLNIRLLCRYSHVNFTIFRNGYSMEYLWTTA